MTPNEAKKDIAAKLNQAGIPFAKLSAKTVSFEGFGYGDSVFVTIHGASMTPDSFQAIKDGIPKPSAGGYVVNTSNCTWIKSEEVAI